MQIKVTSLHAGVNPLADFGGVILTVPSLCASTGLNAPHTHTHIMHDTFRHYHLLQRQPGVLARVMLLLCVYKCMARMDGGENSLTLANTWRTPCGSSRRATPAAIIPLLKHLTIPFGPECVARRIFVISEIDG